MSELHGTQKLKRSSEVEMKSIWGTKKLEDGSLMITAYKGAEKNIVIPSEIGKKIVTAISSDAFDPMAPRITEIQKNNRMKIVSVEFPGSIDEIPERIFGGDSLHIKFPALKRIVLNIGTKKICSGAFQYCVKLKEVILPLGLETLGNMIFWGCTGLETITIPSSVQSFGIGIFIGCRKLQKVSLPDTMHEIPDGMFDGCKALSDFHYPECVTKIGANAFSECSFESITIPPAVKKIEKGAFSECKKLKAIMMSEEIEFGEGAFENCTLLANDKKQVVVNGIFFGMLGSCFDLSEKEAVKPLVLKNNIMSIALSREKLPEIVYKEHLEKGTALDVSTLMVGDLVFFGRFPEQSDCVMKPLRWRVLAIEPEKMLLITENEIMSCRDELKQKGIWKDCWVRNLLNKGFYESAFTEVERKQILCATIDNPENREYHVKGGSSSKDWVFLLSIDELERYMPTQESRKSVPTEYARTQYCAKRPFGYWQLRTPGKGDWGSVAVEDDVGSCNMSGNHVGYSYLRPALWIKSCD